MAVYVVSMFEFHAALGYLGSIVVWQFFEGIFSCLGDIAKLDFVPEEDLELAS